MNKTIISYSLTGNNEAFATRLANEINANHIRVSEPGKRKMGKIVSDSLLNRAPKIVFDPDAITKDDFVLFVGPVWLGKIASPLRSCFKQLAGKEFPYAFISVSGGADGPDCNDMVAGELSKQVGRDPVFFLDLHKADLLPPEPEPTRDMTMDYHINENDLDALVESALPVLQSNIG